MLKIKAFFNKKNKENVIQDKEIQNPESLTLEDFGISVTSTVGTSTGSTKNDFYVYEWYIIETGEIFYIGKGRGTRYKEKHERAYDAEKIRAQYKTGNRFISKGLTEDEAIELESLEMVRVLNETNHRLTNRIIPLTAKRNNGYGRGLNTPQLKFEKAPVLFAYEIEEHYFGKTFRAFDTVNEDNLKAVCFITSNIRDEIDVLYGGNVDNYIEETEKLLKTTSKKILKSKYAKSVSAWIYIGDGYISNYEKDQQRAIDDLGREIPTYHLIDVWKFLKEKYNDIELHEETLEIKPIYLRTSLSEINNLDNWEKGFDMGYHHFEIGEIERKAGNLDKAIKHFDKARQNGYTSPALYNSYAMAFRKLKLYDDEICIIDEFIQRNSASDNGSYKNAIISMNSRRRKAIELKSK